MQTFLEQAAPSALAFGLESDASGFRASGHAGLVLRGVAVVLLRRATFAPCAYWSFSSSCLHFVT